MFKVIVFILLATHISLASAFEIYEKKASVGFSSFYVKVEGFKEEIELMIGVGTPRVLKIESLDDRITLIHCFGGQVGTSHLISYYYTYILDSRDQKVLDVFETYIDGYVDEKLREVLYPKCVLRDGKIHVHDYNDSYYLSEMEHKVKVYKVGSEIRIPLVKYLLMWNVYSKVYIDITTG